MKFTLGDKTNKVWAGELVTECEFISYLPNGKMLFYDLNSKIFRLVFWDAVDNGQFILNGWRCADRPSALI